MTAAAPTRRTRLVDPMADQQLVEQLKWLTTRRAKGAA